MEHATVAHGSAERAKVQQMIGESVGRNLAVAKRCLQESEETADPRRRRMLRVEAEIAMDRARRTRAALKAL
jgi:hypothetical protein